MTAYLVYWKTFWKQVAPTDIAELEQDWYTRNEAFFKRVRPGDVLWVVVNGGKGARNQWRLLQRILVQGKDPLRAKSEHGPHHIIPEPSGSRVFDPRVQPDLTPTLRRLVFEKNRPITAQGALIGRTIQSARPLAQSDDSLLEDHARKLRVLV